MLRRISSGRQQVTAMAGLATLHDRDFYAWTLQQADLLKQRRLAEVDIDSIVEELECMGASERRELINRLAVLMAYLLRWRFQPELRGNSWRNTIDVQRFDIKELLEDNPSLAAGLNERMEKAYRKSVMLAVRETGLSKMAFPVACPFSADQLLSEEFWPEW
ncbi:DUF29 domain-containing protein [Candidatus Contendibacter odensensis]|nr:DUF29 domain-containing protein [Candidatus Contendobacter odensis]